MNDEAFVGELDRAADLAEEGEAGGQVEMVRAAVLRDRQPLDVLHDEVRHAVLGAAVEKSRDVRVLELGENLALEAEPLGHGGPVAPERRDLERHRLPVLVIVPHRLEDEAHAATSDLPDDAIGAEPAAHPVVRCGHRAGGVLDGAGDARPAVGCVRQHPGQLAREPGVAGGFARHEGATLARRELRPGEEEGFQAAPAIVGERRGHGESSRPADPTSCDPARLPLSAGRG